MKNDYYYKEHITTALLLAAGIGSRLYPFTQDNPKCLTLVNGRSLLERLIICLNKHGFKRLVVVTGYLENHIRDFLGDKIGDITIDYVFSPLYKTTNNIYSLWMARKVINEPFLLFESDILFDESLLNSMLYPDKMAVAKMQPWMKGTCVTINKYQQVKTFLMDNTASLESKYKTVNIYSLSLTSWHHIVEKLDQYISDGKVNDYYEIVFADMIAEGLLSFKIVSFDEKPWYEIDTIEDLIAAEDLFSSDTYRLAENITFPQQEAVNMQLINTVTPHQEIKRILHATK